MPAPHIKAEDDEAPGHEELDFGDVDEQAWQELLPQTEAAPIEDDT